MSIQIELVILFAVLMTFLSLTIFLRDLKDRLIRAERVNNELYSLIRFYGERKKHLVQIYQIEASQPELIIENESKFTKPN